MTVSPFSKTYRGQQVLEAPGLELQPGLVYAVVGANGSGKSTFARILAGVIPPDPPAGRPLRGPWRVGYMPQHSYAFRMSVQANILLGGKDRARAKELMGLLQIGHLARRKAHRLSGGELARVALARLLMRPWDLLILDEPTASMDIASTALAEELVLRFRRECGCAVILVTHSIQQARRTADEVFFFHQGALLERGDADTLLRSPRLPETRRFLEFYGL